LIKIKHNNTTTRLLLFQ